MKKTISLVLVLALGLTVESTNADFTFGTPTNLGPTINSSSGDYIGSVSTDGLTLFFASTRFGGSGDRDLWVTTRPTTDDDWEEPVNLGPTINSSRWDLAPKLSSDELSLFFHSNRSGGYGSHDIWVTTRATKTDGWGPPVNLGTPVNSSATEISPNISANGLTLFFSDFYQGPFRSGGFGGGDIWVTTRATTSDPWGEPQNLGPTVNSSAYDGEPSLSANGLTLFFNSRRSGGSGADDLWVTTRTATSEPWGPPVNLGPAVNSSNPDFFPSISQDGYTLLFTSNRSGGFGGFDMWQVSIEPVVDFNGDGIVNIDDLLILIDHWGTDETLCDIGPMPWGDGIVDIQDLIVLIEHFEGIPPVEPEEVNVDEEDDDSQVELEQGQILVVTLESNPTTGYRWEVVETQESILQQMGEAEFKQSDPGGPPLVGAGGWEIFRFKAISAGQMTLQLVYHRAWEEGVEPLKTFSLQVVVR